MYMYELCMYCKYVICLPTGHQGVHKNKQQTQPTYDAGSGNRTLAGLWSKKNYEERNGS